MSLFYVLEENLFVQMPRGEEESFKNVKGIYGKEIIVLCSGGCLQKPICPYHSQKTACDNDQRLLEESRQENN